MPTPPSSSRLVIDWLIFTRAVVALNLITAARLVLWAAWIVSPFAIVTSDEPSKMVVVVVTALLALMTLNRWFIATAKGIVEYRLWAIALVGLILAGLDAIQYFRFVSNVEIQDLAAKASFLVWAHLSFMTYAVLQITARLNGRPL